MKINRTLKPLLEQMARDSRVRKALCKATEAAMNGGIRGVKIPLVQETDDCKNSLMIFNLLIQKIEDLQNQINQIKICKH